MGCWFSAQLGRAEALWLFSHSPAAPHPSQGPLKAKEKPFPGEAWPCCLGCQALCVPRSASGFFPPAALWERNTEWPQSCVPLCSSHSTGSAQADSGTRSPWRGEQALPSLSPWHRGRCPFRHGSNSSSGEGGQQEAQAIPVFFLPSPTLAASPCKCMKIAIDPGGAPTKVSLLTESLSTSPLTFLLSQSWVAGLSFTVDTVRAQLRCALVPTVVVKQTPSSSSDPLGAFSSSLPRVGVRAWGWPAGCVTNAL